MFLPSVTELRINTTPGTMTLVKMTHHLVAMVDPHQIILFLDIHGQMKSTHRAMTGFSRKKSNMHMIILILGCLPRL